MNTFVKATEIWEPNREKTELTLVNGEYGPCKEFEDHSHNMTFTYDEGSDLHALYALKRYDKKDYVTGKAWKTGFPILTKSYTIDEDNAEFSSMLALPILQNGFCKAVVVFYD